MNCPLCCGTFKELYKVDDVFVSGDLFDIKISDDLSATGDCFIELTQC